MPTAYSYIRFSSTKQKLGDSHRRQAEDAEEWASKNGYDLNTEYKDLGVSAFRGKNRTEGALALFIKRVQEGLIPRDSVLVVEAMDRLSREEPHTAQRKFIELMELGLTVVTLTDQQVYSVDRIRKDGGMSLILSIGQIIGAHSQSKTKSNRVKEAYAKRLAKAHAGEDVMLSGSCPGWVRKVEGTKTFELIPHRAATLKRMFELCIAGEGTPSIARILNTTEKSECFGTKPEMLWSQGSVNAAINNPAAYGSLRRRDPAIQPLKDYYPAVVTEAVFMAARAALKARFAMSGRRTERTLEGLDGPKVVKDVNVLAGLLFCQCGTRLRLVGKTHKAKSYMYLRCPKTIETDLCSAKQVDLLKVENCVLQRLLDFKGQRLLLGLNTTTPDPTAELRASIDQKRERITRMVSLASFAGDIEAIGKQVKDLQRSIVADEKMLKKIQGEKQVGEDEVEDAERLWRYMQETIMTPEESYALRLKLQTALRRFVVKLVILNDRRTIRATLSPLVYGEERTGEWDYVAVNEEITQGIWPTKVFDKEPKQPSVQILATTTEQAADDIAKTKRVLKKRKALRGTANEHLYEMLIAYENAAPEEIEEALRAGRRD